MNDKQRAFRIATPLAALGISVALAVGTSGSSSLNDPLYPWMGNGGYDAQHYTIALNVPADHKSIQGTTVMEAVATEDLSSFNLDLGTPEVSFVTVNGARASFKHEDPELTITPTTAITKGSSFRVQVGYKGAPGSRVKADETGGWFFTPSGASFLAQPTGLLDWAAVNDHPADKASFTFRLTAPKEEQAIANGLFIKRQENPDGTATSYYNIAEPTTTYMPMLAFGQFDLIEGGKVGGVRIRNYLSPDTAAYYKPGLDKTADMIRYFNERLGPYPFHEYGIITHDVTAGFALENQTLSSFPAKFEGFDELRTPEAEHTIEEILAHELAHQWFGALVSYRDHSQIFIHEGFAEYLGRRWSEHSFGQKISDVTREDYPGMVYAKDGGYFEYRKAEFVNLLKNGLRLKPDATWNADQVGRALDLMFSDTLPSAARASILEKAASGLSIGQLADEIGQLPFTQIAVTRRINREVRRLIDPSLEPITPSPAPGKIKAGDNPFDFNVYTRGSATLHALNLKVGDESFFKILRTYLERHRFGTATNEDFLAVVAEIGGADARALTEHWLFDDVVPDFPELTLSAKLFPLGADFKP